MTTHDIIAETRGLLLSAPAWKLLYRRYTIETPPSGATVVDMRAFDEHKLLAVEPGGVLDYRTAEREQWRRVFRTHDPRIAVAAVTYLGFTAKGWRPKESLFAREPTAQLADTRDRAVEASWADHSSATFFDMDGLSLALGTDWLLAQREDDIVRSAEDKRGVPLFIPRNDGLPDGLTRDRHGQLTASGWQAWRMTSGEQTRPGWWRRA